MSNFSDFFPAQAATGTGLPVNAYESFYVSGTGSPLGYNATTGLYTHPNGDVWLKTGNTFDDAAGNYPDATIATSANYNTAEGTTGTFIKPQTVTNDTQFMTQSDLYWYIYNNGSSGYSSGITSIAKTGFAQVQRNWRMSSLSNRPAIAVNADDTLTATVSADSSTNIFIRDFTTYSLSYPGTTLYTVTIPANGNNKAIVFGSGTTVWYQNAGNGTIYQYDYTTNTLLQTLSTGVTAPSYGYAWSYLGGTYSYFTSGNGNIYKINMTTGATTVFATFTAQGSNSQRNSITPDLNNFTNALWAITNTSNSWAIYNKTGPFVGDSTARTDTNSGQPLFVKIK
jgi:hypothetical protein